MLIKDKGVFHEEKKQLYEAGLRATRYQQIDDTSARVKGENYYTQSLSAEFDTLFSTETGYAALDERISKTKAKKGSLLLVLKFPELPLHNNASELGARQQVRKRDVSLHTMVPEGTKANGTFLSIVETCKKLGINHYDYFLDRIRRLFTIPPLARIIAESASKQ